MTSLLAILATLLIILHAPPTFAENHHHHRKHHHHHHKPSPAPPPPPPEPYKVLHEFCRQRGSKKDTKFCTRALKKDPRTATATDLVSLLKISVDLAVEKANQTHHFFSRLIKKGTPNRGLIEVLKDCTGAYDLCLKELQIIPSELLDDIDLASYDALMASDALDTCQSSLRKGRIGNRGIVRRQRLSTDYVRLCVDIARGL